MPETQQTQKPEPQQKEEKFSIKFDAPVSMAEQISSVFGVGADEAIPTPDFDSPPGQGEGFKFGGGEEEDMLQSVMAGMEKPPKGVDMQKVQQMVADGAGAVKQMRAEAQPTPGAPAGQTNATEQPADGQIMTLDPRAQGRVPPGQPGGRVPTQAEAYERGMQTPPEITTRGEFEEGKKQSPEWWKKLAFMFSKGNFGDTQGTFDQKMDEAYAEFIEPEIRKQAEFNRQTANMEKFATKPGEEMVKWNIDGQEIEVAKNDQGAVIQLYGKAMELKADKDGMINLRSVMPGDINAPDMMLTKEQALAYTKFYVEQEDKGLGTGRDLLKKYDPELWQFLEDHDFDQAKALIDARQAAEDKSAKKVVQRPMTELDMAQERRAMDFDGEYGRETSPQFAAYLRVITAGRSGSYINPETKEEEKLEGADAISDEERAALRENMQMLNHTRFKGEGGESPYRDFWQRKLDREGWHFMGERIPNDKEKARKALTRMRTQGKANNVQTATFMLAHFGDWNRDFEVDPKDLRHLDPDYSMRADERKRSQEGRMEGTGWIGTRHDLPTDKEIRERDKDKYQAPLGENDYPESEAREFQIENDLTWGETVEFIEGVKKKTIVMGR